MTHNPEETGPLPLPDLPPEEASTLEIREQTPEAKPGAVGSFFFRSAEDQSQEALVTPRQRAEHVERLREAIARRAQRVESGGEVLWRVPWGLLMESLGQVLAEMDKDAGDAPSVLESAFRRAETAIDGPPPPPPEPGPSRAELQARVAALEGEAEMRRQEVRYLEERLREAREAGEQAGRALEESRARGTSELAAAQEARRAAEQQAAERAGRLEALERRLVDLTRERAEREEEAREEEDRLSSELRRLEGLLRALLDDLPEEGDALPPGSPEARLAALRALAVELDGQARERRAGATLLPVPELSRSLARLDAALPRAASARRERLVALREELLDLTARWEAALDRARRSQARFPDLLELAGLAQRACAREQELDALLE